jgi:2,4-dienoyl-CoA reductase-like NADH-dependent reductase (Old Yellow Enzyme family)
LEQHGENQVSAYRNLLSPLTIRGRTFRNRVLSTAHAPGYAESGRPGERYQAYHEEKAKGGIGLTMFGGSSNISRDSGSIYGQIYVGDDSIIPVFRRFADRIHRHGAGLMCQITHMGRRTGWAAGDWLPTVGPSVVRDPAHHSVPRELSTRDITRIVKAFADAAWRCREGGLDGCELLATTHLLGQFLSPLSNFRTDCYGGGLENRARFLFEVMDAVRHRVGDGFVVGVRFAADESNEEGMPAEEGVKLARLIGAHGSMDFINVNGAYGGSLHGLAETFPGMAFKAAPYVELARRVREASGLAVFQAARLSDPATADWAIGEGHVDMAGLTRPHMADPHIVAKLTKGDEARIRPCVGAGYCIDRIYAGGDTLCVHNVSTGRESWLPHEISPAEIAKRVVVIGGGPAGMEAARVAALRGHQVTLHEAGTRTGGQVLLAARAGWRKDMIGIADWLAAELEALGVQVCLNSYIEGSEVLADAPDIVIVATGGVPDASLHDGGGDLAVSTWDLLSGAVSPGEDVLLYDESGGHGAISTAGWLAQCGASVEMVTPDLQAGRNIGGQNIPVYLRNLYAAGATLTPNHRLKGIRREGNSLVATLWNDFLRVMIERRVDQVVIDTCTIPADGPFRELASGASNFGETDIDALVALKPQPGGANPDGTYLLFRIGDAVAQRDIHAAMLDANRLTRTL